MARSKPTIIAVDPGNPFAVVLSRDRGRGSVKLVSSFPFVNPVELGETLDYWLGAWAYQWNDDARVCIEGTYKGIMNQNALATLNMRIGALWSYFARRSCRVYLARTAFSKKKGGGWKHDLDLQGKKPAQREKIAKDKTGLDPRNEHEADALLLHLWFESRWDGGERDKMTCIYAGGDDE